MVRAVALVLLLAVTVPAGAADSFYLNLLREGAAAQDRGEHEEAAVTLRLACFGLLDDPELLVEGLVRLAVSQGELGDLEGFEKSYRRILEVEERLGAYSRARIRPDLRERFETELVRRIPPGTLAESTLFSHLAEEGRLDRVRSLPLREQRSELQRLAKEDPENPQWPLLLAELELREGRPREARRWAEEALARDPASRDALCYRGWSLAEEDGFSGAAADLRACPRTRDDPVLAAAFLRSLLELSAWDEATAVAAKLSPAVGGDPAVRRLVDRLERESPPVQAASPGPPGPAPGVDATSREYLEQARALLREASTPQELARAWELASRLAGAHPQWVEAQLLAGEVAYRASRWSDAAEYFSRGGDLSASPHLLFYYAVSLYESGQREEARAAALACQGRIRQTDFVRTYLEKILAP